MNELYCIVNDKFYKANEASVLINDLALQRAYGIFDFFRTVKGNLMFIDDHLERFFHSAEYMRLPISKSRSELKALLHELNKKNNIPESGIRITLTGGYNSDGYTIATPNIIITQQPLAISKNDDGISLCTYPHVRQFPQIKTIDYLMGIWLKPYVLENKADDVLYEQNGIVSECPRSNFFIVDQDDQVVTPGRNILKGIIRKKVLEIAKANYVTIEKDISLEDIRTAKEAFITSSTKEVLPVWQINGTRIGDGKTGKTSMHLRDDLRKLIY